jgi:uncharacterized ion transporter superfamily protein YfcC
MKQRFKFKVPDAYVIILLIAIAAMAATWVVPAGEYDRVPGSQLVIPDSFHYVESKPVQPLRILLLIPIGLEKASAVIFTILLVGGFLQIVNDTGALEAGLNGIIRKLGRRKLLILPIVMAIMSALGFAGVVIVSVIAFIPLGLLLARQLKLDPLCGIGMMYLGCYAGFTTSGMCASTALLAQEIAGLPPMSGFAVRFLVWMAVLAATIGFVMRYAHKVQRNPQASLHSEFDEELLEHAGTSSEFTLRHVIIVILLASGFVLFGVGVPVWNWKLQHLSAVMAGVGIMSGLIGGMNSGNMVKSFITGCKHMVYSAMIIGLAMMVSLVLEEGRIIYTLVHLLCNALSNLPTMLAAEGMYLSNLLINFFISSGPGQAYITMPIMAPLADVVGIERQTAVSAFVYGDGFSNIIIPTSGVLMSVIAMGKVPYTTWLRFIFPLCALWVFIGGIAIAYAVYFGW